MHQTAYISLLAVISLLGACVMTEAIDYIFVEEMLPANNTRILQATCAPGDTFITSGCQLDDIQVGFKDLQ